MFTEVPFLDRFEAAAAAGFRAVEFMFPYAHEAAAVAEAATTHDLQIVLFNAPAGNWSGGERGLAALPKRVSECQEGVVRALKYAKELRCRRLHLMAGVTPENSDRESMLATYVTNIRFAADLVADDGMEILIEPINTRIDVPGYFLDNTTMAEEILNSVDRRNVKLQYDIYHMQIMQGDLIRRLEQLIERIGHIQIADNPGRAEPGSGEINFRNIFKRLETLEYSGYVGCEYRPAAGTVAGLSWASPFLSGSG